MNQEKIGKFIAELRKEKNMTQQDLATKLNVTDRAISNWENGRRLPDYSLIKNLCDELGITINELLSGEKLKKEEQKNKFEENIINTLDYSDKKEKRLKKIAIYIIAIIVLIFITLFTLFIIDFNRMLNNEPVLFSTWGFSYEPPINLDAEKIEKAIKEYLIEEDERNNRYENEKSFVAMRTYLIEETKENKYYIYAWVLQDKYHEENGKIVLSSGFSIPHKFEVVKVDNKFIVSNYIIPEDSGYSEEEMLKIFPKKILDDIYHAPVDGTVEKLDFNIQEQVELYFHTKLTE